MIGYFVLTMISNSETQFRTPVFIISVCLYGMILDSKTRNPVWLEMILWIVKYTQEKSKDDGASTLTLKHRQSQSKTETVNTSFLQNGDYGSHRKIER